MCKFCERLKNQKQIRAELNEWDGTKKKDVITVAMIIRTKENGRFLGGRITDYRCRGCGYELNFCPECGKDLRNDIRI